MRREPLKKNCTPEVRCPLAGKSSGRSQILPLAYPGRQHEEGALAFRFKG
jgi:hypothetical protein